MRIRYTFGPVPDATRVEADTVACDAFGLLARFARVRFRVPGWWSPDFRTDWSERRTSSGGRLDRITISMWKYVPADARESRPFYEYASIEDDPVCGTIDSGDWRDSLSAAVAHETAHSLADLLKGSDPVMFSGGIDEIRRRFRPHGGLWLDVYRELRTRVVNAGTRVPEEGWAGIDVPPAVWCGAAFSPRQEGVEA
ncbi:hypothetical protein [Azospirillum sp. TSO5]|uniref:hypothetical protein n=1 Tax=Azospirillum sp. TSO5 TaxID=716760 RepID=UPI000D619C9A|nr:hypothetical protein [Azospirillum sp. TSO5]PWC93019.1 hypothetical protein TSO5_16520 [Azospirillum sp. TSO5]